MARFTFERRDGKTVTVDVTINEERVARYLADRINRRHGAKRATALEGAVSGVLVEEASPCR